MELQEPQRLQKYLFQAIKDRASSEKKIFLATHSHHFLDYEDSTNNYVCCRASNGKIYLEESDLQQIIFRLLGNTLSSLLLPENIVVLEGPSDTLFLSKCFSILNKVKYAIHSSGSDSNINYAINSITQFLQFNKGNSVYKNNIYVIADQAKDSLVRLWERMLPDAKKQLKVLSLNGIEHYYPARILQEIFDTSDSPSKIVGGFLKNKPTQYNGKNFSKVELAKLVSEKLIESDLAENDNELFDFIKKLP